MRSLSLVLALLVAAPSFAEAIDAGTVEVLDLDAGLAVVDAGVVQLVDGGVVVVPPPSVNLPGDDVNMQWMVDAAKAIYQAVKTKDWGNLIFLIVTVLVVITRKFIAPKVPFFNGKLGAPLLAFLWAAAGAVATTWTAGERFEVGDIWLVLQAGIIAAGGWSLVKNFLEYFYPKEAGQENWATVIAGWIGASKPKTA